MTTTSHSGTSLILHLLAEHHVLRPVQLITLTDLSRQRVHQLLSSLLKSGKIIRKGRSPLTFYALASPEKESSEAVLDVSIQQADVLHQEFILIKNEGTITRGKRAVCEYAHEHHKDPQHVAEQFLQERQRAPHSRPDSGASDQIEMLREKKPLEESPLERYNFADYEQVASFGKTALAQRVQLAKSTGDKILQTAIFKETERQIHEYIAEYGIDAVAFNPGTSDKGRAFMRRWRDVLDLPLPHLNWRHTFENLPVSGQQVELNQDRKLHAARSLTLDDHRHNFKHVLLIDDAVYSGHTLAHMSEELTRRNCADKISAYTIIYSLGADN